MEKKRPVSNAFPLVFSLRWTCHNADSERKINKMVFLHVIHPIHNFPPALKQKSLFPTTAALNKTYSILSREWEELSRSRNPRRPRRPGLAGGSFLSHPSSSSTHNSSFCFLLACFVILLGWEYSKMSPLHLGR